MFVYACPHCLSDQVRPVGTSALWRCADCREVWEEGDDEPIAKRRRTRLRPGDEDDD
jgi:ribosomal protein L37AE/L43A